VKAGLQARATQHSSSSHAFSCDRATPQASSSSAGSTNK
jgi:hypothetical protein